MYNINYIMPSFFIFHYEVFNTHGIGIYHQKNGAFQIGSSEKLFTRCHGQSKLYNCGLWFDENITFATFVIFAEFIFVVG